MSNEMTVNEPFSDVERLLVAQAMFKKLSDVVSTKNRTSLRGMIDAEYKKEYEHSGGKQYSMRFRGEKVATYTVKESQPSTKTVYDLDDWDVFEAWARSDDGFEMLMSFAVEDPQKFMKYVLENTGEIPGGVVPRTVEDHGGEYAGSAISQLNADRVLELARGDAVLPSPISGLLGR